LGGALLGALVFWMSPFFAATMLVWVLLYLGPTLVYVQTRNRLVPVGQRVLTRRHFRELARKYLHIGMAEAGADFRTFPIRFIAKSIRGQEEDTQRVRRVEDSPGYKAALQLVYRAIQMRTTDVHMEPTRQEMT